jgi:hypothetical protein
MAYSLLNLKLAGLYLSLKLALLSSVYNYRPISLLSTLSKLLEKIVCTQLVQHLEANNLLYLHQYGFQHGKSTEHNLIQLTNFIHSALNEKKIAIGIFLDLKKAFDVCTVNLKKLGINGTHTNGLPAI